MKGDRVEIVIDAGSGTTRTYDVTATRAGRKVNVTHGRGVVEVSEVTRGGTTVRTARSPRTSPWPTRSRRPCAPSDSRPCTLLFR